MKYGISREEECNLPKFASHDEAIKFFKNKYGDNFRLMGSEILCGQKVYYYKLILDKVAFDEMLKEIEDVGFATLTERYFFSSQDIQIFDDGNLHIVH